MKKIIIPISALFVVGLSHAQSTNLSTNENYVYSKTYLSDPALPNPKSVETVQYIDGLGRPKQVVNIKASPTQKDVVTHIEYDGFGRQVKDYLPVPQSNTLNGAIIPNPLANATQPEIYGSEKIYAEKILENSPLDRIQQQVQVGNDWTGKPVKFDYDANKNEDYVRKYKTTTTWVEGRTHTAVELFDYFLPNQLYKNTVTDEDGNKTIEFKNGQGQTLLIRKVLSATENADTYYVYNEYDQLAYVIPPLASAPTVESATVENLYYQYRYDGRNRLVEKKLPGKGWEYMVYDKADRLIATQDANLRQTSTWFVTKYDSFGRVIYTGLMPLPNQSREGLQGITNQYVIIESRNSTGFSRNGMQIYYTNGLYSQIETILSVNYYDEYPAGSPAIPTQVLGQNVLPQDAQNSNISTKSLPTASYVKNIEDDNWTKNYTWYDTKGRVIGSHSVNHLGGYTKTESELDFSGTPKQVFTRHKRLAVDTERVITENFTYDHQNSLLVHTHQVDNQPVEYLVQNKYNELSQLQTKKVGGMNLGSGLQAVDYKYNIRGWMTKINDPSNLGDDLFGYKINYNIREGSENPNSDFADLKVKPKYNGNIAEVFWKTLTEYNEPLKRYAYTYDPLNRLSAGFYERSGFDGAKEYFEINEYDLNGNIKRLQRSAELVSGTTALKIDDLKYDYAGNRLIKVKEEQIGNSNGYPYLTNHNTIEYDNGLLNGNGNMTKHLDKGISSIQYNYLNLPVKINQNTQVTDYTYRADGVKVKKLFGDIETNYLDGFQYKSTKPSEGSSGGLVVIDPDEIAVMKLRIIPTSEGYYDVIQNQYIYNYTDHLGNVRLSYSDTSKDGVIQPRTYYYKQCDGLWSPWNPPNCIDYWKPGEIVEVNNYYPFGLLHNYTATTQNAYQYKYNGKELQETGMYDYGARFYMPDIGRWGVIDPLAEVSRRWSPYTYVLNNPIKYIDPDGREVVETASGTTYTGADAQSAFLALKNQLGNGPGPKGSWGGVSWQKYINNWNYEDSVELYRENIKARVGTLKSINGNATLNVKQTIGQWDKEYGFLPVNRTNFANENAMQVTNCYGYVLTNGYFFVDDNIENIRGFLLDSGYKSSQAFNKTNFKTGDILLWEGHMMEAVGSKNGKVQWESYFGFDSSPVKGSLQQVMNYNKEVSGGGYGSLQGASLYRQQDQSKIQFGQKKYESVDVKTIQQQKNQRSY